MKPNELRIGNWFKYKDSPKLNDKHRNNYAQIIGDDIVWMEENERDDIDELVEAIPLTEEWLERFGFKKKEDGWHLILDNWSKIVVADDFSFGLSDRAETSYDGREGDFLAFGNDILDSVHRLQNLYFALTGKELEFKEITNS